MRLRVLLRRAPAMMVAALLLAPGPLRAQSVEGDGSAANLPRGARLRVDVLDRRGRQVVRLVRASSDTLRVRRWSAAPGGADDTVALALTSVRRLQRSRGRHTHVRRNGGYALAGGVLAGGILGAIEGANDDGEWFDLTPAEGALIVGVAIGIPAGMIGALSGLVPTEEWIDVALPADARVTSEPRRDGLVVRPRLGLTHVPMRGAPAARAITLGLTLRPR